MAYISGGVYANSRAKATVERLINLTKRRIAAEETEMHDENLGIQIVAGRHEMESDSDVLKILSDGFSLYAGRVFSKDGTFAAVDVLPIERIKETHGVFLAEHYWGRYLLVSFDPKTRALSLYRDPQGLLTIFYMPIDCGVLFSTDIEFLYDAVEVKPEPNWNYLTSFVINAHNIMYATPFIGISEASPGRMTQISLSSDGTIHTFWNPTKIKSTPIKDEQTLQETIFQKFSACTRALTKDADRVVVRLSGGLDSSSVAAVLKDELPKSKKIIGLNLMHTDVQSSNEVRFAQIVADDHNFPLKVVDYKARRPFQNQKIPRRFNRPFSSLIDYEFDPIAEAGITIEKHDEIISGQGGDHLFTSAPRVEAISDHFIDRGFQGLHEAISEFSAYRRTSYIKVIAQSLLAGYKYFKGDMSYIKLTFEEAPWMTDSFKSLLDTNLYKGHVWEDLPTVLPGKALHTFSIYQSTQHLDRGYRIPGKPILYPFLAQPLIELALSIPSYQSLAKGYNRYHFRSAMSKFKSGNYIWRKSKAETSGIDVLMFKNSYELLSNLATTGRFAQMGFIDKQKMQQALNEVRHGKVEQLWPILNLLVVERWLQSWDL